MVKYCGKRRWAEPQATALEPVAALDHIPRSTIALSSHTGSFLPLVSLIMLVEVHEVISSTSYSDHYVESNTIRTPYRPTTVVLSRGTHPGDTCKRASAPIHCQSK